MLELMNYYCDVCKIAYFYYVFGKELVSNFTKCADLCLAKKLVLSKLTNVCLDQVPFIFPDSIKGADIFLGRESQIYKIQ